jgi:hypothetical protein
MKSWQLAQTLPQPLKTILMLRVVAFVAVLLGFIALVFSGPENVALSVIP